MGTILAVVLIVGLLSGMCILDGLVLQVLWGWFLVPLGLPPIGVAMAIGLGAIATFMFPSSIPRTEKGQELEQFVDTLVNWVLKLVLVLAIAWVAHKYL